MMSCSALISTSVTKLLTPLAITSKRSRSSDARTINSPALRAARSAILIIGSMRGIQADGGEARDYNSSASRREFFLLRALFYGHHEIFLADAHQQQHVGCHVHRRIGTHQYACHQRDGETANDLTAEQAERHQHQQRGKRGHQCAAE